MTFNMQDYTACSDCGVYYEHVEFDDFDENGHPVKVDKCAMCRKLKTTKQCVDCFVCGATMFFTEQQLTLKSNLASSRISQHPNGHLVIFKDKFVVACCWPLTRANDIQEAVDNMIEKLPILIP